MQAIQGNLQIFRFLEIILQRPLHHEGHGILGVDHLVEFVCQFVREVDGYGHMYGSFPYGGFRRAELCCPVKRGEDELFPRVGFLRIFKGAKKCRYQHLQLCFHYRIRNNKNIHRGCLPIAIFLPTKTPLGYSRCRSC
uniref:Uncharacterized protein n=1 Tax=Candidatus Kentrum sp. FW TaxID=2126338 RepID=A0A450TE53_9GAMM|nr:MAG: hypothetical protein BECKFW1821B_GA0114236_11029 [Candidatus Kentron sp. FW]